MREEEIYIKAKLLEGESLCQTCIHAHIVQGHAESERRVWCTYGRWDRPEVIGFAVRECSQHQGREQTDLRQMEKMAWVLLTRRGSGRAPGFVTPQQVEEFESADDD